ncbi:MAG: (E)-4-hydroxy-3-methylbut-2-enyl-diphosphate synthase [Bacteroidales bacterium]|nr:(E)-4-hydroxy-3-methylbut-2-enyl-diphosphate synthase [Bacteroidales bacterium]
MIYTSKEIQIGNLKLGGDNPVRIQSMTNTDTMDTRATVDQTMALVDAGCELVRITAPDVKAAENLYNIKNELLKRNYNVPLVADIHFNPKAAEVAATIVEKVRINPGNYVDRNTGKTSFTDQEYADELSRIADRMSHLIDICKQHGTAMRIGVNHGSLSERIMSRYGDTPLGMATSAVEFAQICRQMDFQNLVFSMKASNVNVMVYSTRLLVQKMIQNGMYFPIHLGVTEAGDAEQGRIKSAAGIGTLLLDGIGDTIRVSLTESPVAEIPVAKSIVEHLPRKKVSEDDILKLKTAYEPCTDKRKIAPHYADDKEYSIRGAAELGRMLIDGEIAEIDDDSSVAQDIMQGVGAKIFKAEYISCPSCGRTQYDIQQALQEIKRHTSHLKGIKIGVMGCIVNGPGEMADAHYGYVGSGKGKITLYKGKEVVCRNIDQKDAVARLVQLIKDNGDWTEKG